MSDLPAFRRLAATATIGSFSVAALMGIVALLAGGGFGQGEARVLLTTLVVGCASICLLCYLGTAGTRWAAVGAAGAVALVVPTASALILIWGSWDGDPEGLWKSYGIGVVAAVTLAQLCLLLALAGDRPSLALILWSTVALAVLLALIVTGLILGEVDADGTWRLLGIVAILDVLGTLVTIALAKFGREDVPDPSPASYDVRLTGSRAAALQQLARVTGRSGDELVAEAIDLFLAQPATGASDRVTPA